LATNSTAIAKVKRRWERAEWWLEVASVVGGLMVGVGLWVEGETSVGQRLVTSGVAMEVICAWWVLVASRKLQNILETEFETLRLETASANERAAESGRIAATANLEIARLTLELERLTAPRIIAQREQVIGDLRSIVAELIPYGSLRVEIFTLDNDDEVVRLRDQLIDVLQQAGWEPRMNQNRRVMSGGLPVNGVTVEMQAGTTVRQLRGRHGDNVTYDLGRKGLAMVKALQTGGLWVNGPYPTSNMVTDAQLEIIVGNKPQ
jgi:hypothetical protein